MASGLGVEEWKGKDGKENREGEGYRGTNVAYLCFVYHHFICLETRGH
jgi:hypothetical protein